MTWKKKITPDNSNTGRTSQNTSNQSYTNSDSNNTNSSKSDTFPDFDINTILKLKGIMESMNNNKDDPRANLLLSLKPYLKKDRKEKVD